MSGNEGYVQAPDGVRLFFQKLGNKPKTVIIPNAVHMFESFKRLAEHRTVIFFDLRNRGASDSVSDHSKLAGGIHHDVDDLEVIRQHFNLDQVDVIGHSYVGLTVVLYAMKYPSHVRRLVQIGPIQPNAQTQYPAHLTNADATLAEFMTKLSQLQNEREGDDPTEACKKFWDLMRTIYVADPADAGKIHWTPCDSPNEVNFMTHWTANILPSIHKLELTPDELSRVLAPVLTIHGTKDRQAPYGGGLDWAKMLPNARLLTVEDAAHVPWIEASEKVFGAIETFLDGTEG